MKIKRITLEDYQQFRNFTLDLTYPEGHPKAGQPLDKVCFIGQSGTGKTTLLNLFFRIAYLVNGIIEGIPPSPSSIHGIYEILLTKQTYKIGSSTSNNKSESKLYINNQIALSRTEGTRNNSQTFNSTFQELFHEYTKTVQKLMIYFSADLLSNQEFLIPKPKPAKKNIEEALQTEKKTIDEKRLKNARLNRAKEQKIIQVGDRFQKYIWNYAMQDIDEYDEMVREKGVAFLQTTKDINNFDKKFHEFRNWIIHTPNPRKELAEKCLNPILEKFQLQMDTENADGLIKIKHKDGSPIPNRGLSTGTKQVILTALPLYKFDTKDTVILFDEPERSLFPDIQQELVDYYVSLAPEAQFFFATHSPMIASSFEPYERFILTFDEEGYVTSKSCWRGDAPKGADPNDILVEDFKLRSYRNEFGRERWEEYVALQEKIRQTTDEKERKALLKRFRELGDAYKFDI